MDHSRAKRPCLRREDPPEALGRDPTDGADAAESCSHAWLPEIIERIAAQLPSNEVACTLRLVDRVAAGSLATRNIGNLSESTPHRAFAAHWQRPGACRGLTLARRLDLVRLTAETGDVANLAVAVEAAGVVLDEWLLRSAARAGQLDACKWLCEPGRLPPYINRRRAVLEPAAHGGHRAVCEWALDSPDGPELVWNDWAVCRALRGGHAELADWLLSVQPEGSEPVDWLSVLQAGSEVCSMAAFRQLCCRSRALGRLSLGDKDSLLSHAASCSTVDWQEKMDYLESRGAELVPEGDPGFVYVRAVELSGDAAAERLAWLAKRGFDPVEGGAMKVAMEEGNTAAVRYLLGRGIRAGIKPEALEAAARKGDLELLRALHKAGCKLPVERLIDGACCGGRVEVMEWLIEVFSAETRRLLTQAPPFCCAASSGSCRLMRWMTEHGAVCRQPSRACWHAGFSGSEELLELLPSLGAPMPRLATFRVRAVWFVVASRGDLRTLGVLRRMGLPWGSHNGATFSHCVFNTDWRSGASLEALQWLLAEGCPVSWPGARGAARKRLVRFDPEEENAKVEAERVLAWVEEQAEAVCAAPAGRVASTSRTGEPVRAPLRG